MTKKELLTALNKVDDDARITVNKDNGDVIDVKEVFFAKAAPNRLNQDEVYLRITD